MPSIALAMPAGIATVMASARFEYSETAAAPETAAENPPLTVNARAVLVGVDVACSRNGPGVETDDSAPATDATMC